MTTHPHRNMTKNQRRCLRWLRDREIRTYHMSDGRGVWFEDISSEPETANRLVCEIAENEETVSREVRMTVCSAEFAKCGYSEEADLIIQPDMGRWVARLWLTDSSGEEIDREIAWEPSDPEQQRGAVEESFRNPKGCIMEAIAIDKQRHEDEDY